MKTLIEHIAKGLVDDPDQVQILEAGVEDGVELYELKVAGEDMGKVIGRQGRTAKALRSVVRVAAARHGRRASVEIVD